MDIHRFIAVIIFVATAYSTIAHSEPPNPQDAQTLAMVRAWTFPNTDNPKVARVYATVFLVQEYLRNRKPPYDIGEGGFVNLIRITKDALK